ncbi:MAG: hypothetical protein ABJL99_12425 [Aliishimia sp.]
MSLLRPHPEKASNWVGAFILSGALHAAVGAYMFDLISFERPPDAPPISFPNIAISNIVLEQQELVALEPNDPSAQDPSDVEADTPETPETERLEPSAADEIEPSAEPDTLEPVEPEAQETVEAQEAEEPEIPETAETLEPVEADEPETPEIAETLEPIEPETPETAETLDPVIPDAPEAVAIAPVTPDNTRLTPIVPNAETTVQGAVVQSVAPVAATVTAVQTVTRVAPVASPSRPKPTPVVQAPAPPPPPPPSPEDLAVLELIDRIRNRFGDTCLIALPQNQGSGINPLVTIISDEDRTMATFATEVLSDPDLPVDDRQVLIDNRQCAALDFARARPNYPTFRIDLALQSRLVSSGDRLAGRIGGIAGRYTSLLLIDSNGVVQDLRRFTRFTQGAAEFDVPVTVNGAGRDTSQLLVAVATNGRPVTVTQRAGQRAQDFFPALGAEIGNQAVIAILPFDVR